VTNASEAAATPSSNPKENTMEEAAFNASLTCITECCTGMSAEQLEEALALVNDLLTVALEPPPPGSLTP
jgi:hypothetical protein